MFFVREGTNVSVEAIGTVKLKLVNGMIMQLSDVLFVPKMRRNLVSASKLVNQGYYFMGNDESIKFFKKGSLQGKVFLLFGSCNALLKLKICMF